jgi:two-component system CheB/CheR fusion protein
VTDTRPTNEPSRGRERPSIVGIGASAGGLEALTRLFRQLPPTTGLAFVLVQHLDPKHASFLPDLLARTTQMFVKQASDNLLIEPDQVYVAPPNTSLTIEGDITKLVPRDQAPGPRMPIDRFLCSLAESHTHRAIGVILSGTGSDGTLGLEAINAAGGITFAQDRDSAKYDGMPNSAIASGCVDLILPPEGIADELARIADHPYIWHVDEAVGDSPTGTADPLHAILALLQQTTGVDFFQYRQTTIQRRIFRRMAVHRIERLGEYLQYLEQRPPEVWRLYDEMVPRVTRFFRDPDAFAVLKQGVFPRLLEQRTRGAPIRVWVPGCATGEEAYSIGISLAEFLEGRATDVQIFGTDLSATAIERARAGWYPDTVVDELSAERRRFFVKRSPGYQVCKSLREMCVFAKHDLTGDPPYSKMDLISCRNVLIYLNTAQERVIPVFHYALQPGGFLMLGAHETAARFPDLFAVVNKEHQIYAKKEVALTLPEHRWLPGSPVRAPKSDDGRRADRTSDLQQAADRALASAYAPAGVIVNDELRVVQVRGNVGNYLETAPGAMSESILSMASRSGLARDLHAAIAQARRERTPTRREGRILRERDGQVNVQVIPLGASDQAHQLVLFEEVAPASRANTGAAAKTETQTVVPTELLALQQELATNRVQLLALIDQHERSSAEFESNEEEALSSIEELQSVNEELETAKEELQSTNEELTTVNEELQTRNVDLQQARDFASSIVDTVRHPLMVLNANLRVQTANRSFYDTFRLQPHETEGQSLYDLSGGAWSTPSLRRLLGQVLPANQAFDDCELEHDFPGLGRRAMVLNARRLEPGHLILLALEDITTRRQAEQSLQQSQEQLRHGQKMEAIGRLAGGVAHDFNNLLTIILGYSGLLLQQLNGESLQQVEEIQKAAERASALTHQLLVFSRRQVLHPERLNLNTVVADLDRMLRRLVGEHVGLVIATDPALGWTLADAGQVGQIIMNLSLNARDAMPEGGTLTIETANIDLDETLARLPELPLGRYVRLAVRDTGSGMAPEVQTHVFEPFFTTKEPGQGTGLGLATVFGIVEQTGGTVRFSSEMGRGTTFEVYFPRLEEPAEGSKPRARLSATARGFEVVFVVEDEDAVRELTRRLLEQQGYIVLMASNGEDCLTTLEAHPDTVHLLLTDVVMPGMGGRELAERAAALRPDIKVLFMSGHTDDALLRHGVTKGGSALLQKPFSLTELAAKVREVLDEWSNPE